MNSDAPTALPLDERIDGLDRQLALLVAKNSSALLLSKCLALLLGLALAVLMALLFFPNLLPGKQARPGNMPAGLNPSATAELQQQMYDMNNDFLQEMRKTKADLKDEIVESRRQTKNVEKELLKLKIELGNNAAEMRDLIVGRKDGKK